MKKELALELIEQIRQRFEQMYLSLGKPRPLSPTMLRLWINETQVILAQVTEAVSSGSAHAHVETKDEEPVHVAAHKGGKK